VKTAVKAAVFAVPGDLATPTGGYAYDRRMIAELAALGWRTDVVNLGEGFPRPTADTRAAACARLAALPSAAPIVIDGLAFGVLPEAAKKMQASHLLVALVHHPLALESGLSADEAAGLHVSERVALAAARYVVTTSAATALMTSPRRRALASDTVATSQSFHRVRRLRECRKRCMICQTGCKGRGRMNHHDHVALLRGGFLDTSRAADAAVMEQPVWADLGSGGGAFTLALAELLREASVCVEHRPENQREERRRSNTVQVDLFSTRLRSLQSPVASRPSSVISRQSSEISQS